MDNEHDLFNENIAAILNMGGKKQAVRPQHIIDDNVRQRTQKQRLRVTFPDGKVFCRSNATTTFVEVLRYIGPEKVATVGLEVAHYPLILKEIPIGKDKNCKPLDNGWHVLLEGSASDTKYRQLLRINEVLGLGMNIEIGSKLETDGTKGFQKSPKKSQCLLVKMADGTFIGGQNPIDTYVNTIKKLGVDMLQRKDMTYGGKKLISVTQQVNGQIEVGRHQWLLVPPLTKDKLKCLNMIAGQLHIKMEVSIL